MRGRRVRRPRRGAAAVLSGELVLDAVLQRRNSRRGRVVIGPDVARDRISSGGRSSGSRPPGRSPRRSRIPNATSPRRSSSACSSSGLVVMFSSAALILAIPDLPAVMAVPVRRRGVRHPRPRISEPASPSRCSRCSSSVSCQAFSPFRPPCRDASGEPRAIGSLPGSKVLGGLAGPERLPGQRHRADRGHRGRIRTAGRHRSSTAFW